jgi:hypothetical protein
MFDFFTSNDDSRRSNTVDYGERHSLNNQLHTRDKSMTLKSSKKYSYEKDLFVSKILNNFLLAKYKYITN